MQKAIGAALNGPFGVVDAFGNLIMGTRTTAGAQGQGCGTISTVAGTGMTGYAGDGGAARNAWLNGPRA